MGDELRCLMYLPACVGDIPRSAAVVVECRRKGSTCAPDTVHGTDNRRDPVSLIATDREQRRAGRGVGVGISGLEPLPGSEHRCIADRRDDAAHHGTAAGERRHCTQRRRARAECEPVVSDSNVASR
jgi:hypothetical protein